MYGTYCSATVLAKRPTTVDASGRGSSPTGPGRTTRAARDRAGASERRRRAAGRAAPARLSTSFSTSRSPERAAGTMTVDRVVPVAARTRGARPRSRPSAAQDSRRALDPVEPELEPAPSTPSAPLGQQPQPVVVGRGAPELEAGPGDEDVAAVAAELRQHPGLPRRRRPACPRLEHAAPALGGRRRRAAERRSGRAGSASCCQATSWPSGAHSVAGGGRSGRYERSPPLAGRRGRA